MRTLFYEAANVMFTRYRGPAEVDGFGARHCQTLEDAKERIAVARRLVIIMPAMQRHGTKFRAT